MSIGRHSPIPGQRSALRFIASPLLLSVLVLLAAPHALAATYAWLASAPADTIARRFAPPDGFERVPAADGSFEAWLRALPLKPAGAAVHLHNGALKGNQDAHAAVLDIDVGRRDLQQCADAVMRLRAEYLYAHNRHRDIHFKFTSGDEASFQKWSEGYRARIDGNRVRWVKNGDRGTSYRLFRQYLDTVFTYAGTASLSKELKPARRDDMRIGDVFIQGGFPGHAVLVVDMAAHPKTGAKAFMLVQSYMPAQEIHVLRVPGAASITPWYPLEFGDQLQTPEWRFRSGDLKRF